MDSRKRGQTPVKVTTRQFGELEEHELIHLLDSIDDEIARARFRESIYTSVIVCLALAWFAFYGPRVLFHEGRIVNPKEEVTELNKKELPFIETPKSLIQKVPPKPKFLDQQSHVAQSPHPDQKPPAPRPAAPGTPAPRPASPQPQPQPQPQAQRPLPAAPQPQPSRQASNTIPDAPKPSLQPQTPRPDFSTSEVPGKSIHDAARDARRGAGGNFAPEPVAHGSGAQTGVEILSDTLGDDFWPYIKRLHTLLETAWLPLIPEECSPPLSKTGQTIIRVTINRDGTIAAMHLEDSTHDQAIDRAAWGSFTSQGQFPPFPKNFKSDSLEMRWYYTISRASDRSAY